MKKNVVLLFLTKIIRTFSYGFLGVLFPVYITTLGTDARGLGIAVALTLLSSAAFTYGVRSPAEKYGIRPILIFLSCCILASGALFLISKNFILIVCAAMLGNLAVGTGETGPFLSMEQVLLSRHGERHKLTTIMSLYNLAGYGSAALGASFIGQIGAKSSFLFTLFLCGGLIQIVIYSFLESNHLQVNSQRQVSDLSNHSLIHKIAALYAMDSFAGGFILQTILVYWFQKKFQLDIEALGWIFFGTQMLSGLSFLLAPYLSKKIGLVNAMVFSHLISNLLLIAVGYASQAVFAIGFLFSRHLLSQIDVPTRQAFLMLAVEDHERERAASLTNVSRTLAQAVSPALTGWIMQFLSLSAPFLFGGGIKIIYDLSLYSTIKHLKIKK